MTNPNQISEAAQIAKLLENLNAAEPVSISEVEHIIQRAITEATQAKDAEIAAKEQARYYEEGRCEHLTNELRTLRAELESAKRDANEWFGKWERNQAEKLNLSSDLTTERTAREAAEAKLAEYTDSFSQAMTEENDALRARLEGMEQAINTALKINREVNKLPVGNFYLAETMEGFLSLASEPKPEASSHPTDAPATETKP